MLAASKSNALVYNCLFSLKYVLCEAEQNQRIYSLDKGEAHLTLWVKVCRKAKFSHGSLSRTNTLVCSANGAPSRRDSEPPKSPGRTLSLRGVTLLSNGMLGVTFLSRKRGI